MNMESDVATWVSKVTLNELPVDTFQLLHPPTATGIAPRGTTS